MKKRLKETDTFLTNRAGERERTGYLLRDSDLFEGGRNEKVLKVLKLYLETSAWNFYFADDAPEKMEVTKESFESVFKGRKGIQKELKSNANGGGIR